MRLHFINLVPRVALLLAATFLVSAFCGCTRAAKKERHLVRGQQFFKAEEYDKAEIEFLNVLRLDNTNAIALRHIGLSYYQQGRLMQAYAFLQKAAEVNPTDHEVRLRLAGILTASRKLKEARAHLEAILGRDPANGDALTLLADAVGGVDEIESVRKRIEACRPHAQNKAGFHLALGTLHLRQQQTNEALASFQRALAVDSQSSPAHIGLGNLFTLAKDTSRAEFHFKKAAELAPVRSARRVQYADFKIRQGDSAGAKAFLQSMVKEAPDYIPPYSRLAEIALNERQFDEAVALTKKTLSRDPGNFEALLLSGRINIARGRPTNAVADFERLVAAYPRVPHAHYHLAVTHLLTRNQSKAVASLQQALNLDPKHTDSQLLLAELNVRKGDYGPAISALKQLLGDQPHIAQAHLLLAAAYRAQRDLPAAASVYETMAGLFPRNPQPYALWGEVLLLQRQRPAARQKFEKALQIAPDFLPALQELVELDIDDKLFTSAETRLQNHIGSFPKSPAPLVLLAKVYSAQTNFSKAEDALDRATRLDPDYQPAYLALARLYVESNKHSEALARLQAALAKSPQDTAALMLKGMIETQLKNYAMAAESYERLLAVNARYIPALNNLAYLYSEHLNQLDKAYTIARTARDLQPYNGHVADTFGLILLKRGEFPWALALFRESAEKLPKDPEVLYHLGLAHYMLGEEQPARAAFERALESARDFPGKADAESRLAFLTNAPSSTQDIAALEQRLKAHPHDPVLLVRLASFHEQAQAPGKALAAYEQALRYSPKNVSVMLKIAQLYAGSLQDRTKAVQVARTARTLAPDDPQVGHILGRLAFQAADYDWSLSLLQESARRLNDRPDVLYDLAWAWFSVGQIADAYATMKKVLNVQPPFSREAEAKRFVDMTGAVLESPSANSTNVPDVLKHHPGYAPALFASGLLQERAGNAEAARDFYRQVLTQFPNFSPAHKRLAILFSGPLSDAGAAYEHATRARKALPDDPEVARTLGILSFSRREYSRAVPLLRESARKHPNDAESFYYLGMAQFHLREKTESRRALQHAVSLAPGASFAAEAKRVIAQLD